MTPAYGPHHRRPADPSSPPDSRRSRRQAGEHGGRPAGRRPRGARGRLPAVRKGGSRVLLTPRSESRGSQNGAMAPFSVRATTRKALKSTREPPFHATGHPVARPDHDSRGRQSVNSDAVDNNGNAVTSEDVLSGPLRPADPGEWRRQCTGGIAAACCTGSAGRGGAGGALGTASGGGLSKSVAKAPRDRIGREKKRGISTILFRRPGSIGAFATDLDNRRRRGLREGWPWAGRRPRRAPRRPRGPRDAARAREGAGQVTISAVTRRSRGPRRRPGTPRALFCRRPGQRVGASAPSTGEPPGSAASAPDSRTRTIGGDGPLG